MNDRTRNKFVPWQEKGDWYRFLVESDGTDYTLTVKDIDGASISGGYLKLPSGFHVVDQKIDVNVDTAAAATFEQGLRLYADGSEGIVLPEEANMDWTWVYVFGYQA